MQWKTTHDIEYTSRVQAFSTYSQVTISGTLIRKNRCLIVFEHMGFLICLFVRCLFWSTDIFHTPGLGDVLDQSGQRKRMSHKFYHYLSNNKFLSFLSI